METDRQLVRRCLDGERRAFDRLYDRHERRVYGLLRRLSGSEPEAADLAQETFLAAYRGLSAWQEQGPFATWLCGIAVRLAANARRRAGGRGETEDLDEECPALALDDDPLAHCAGREAVRRIEAAVAALPGSCREVFVLVKIEGLSYREAAAALAVPLGTVQSRLWRAIRLLQAALRDLAGEPEEPAPGAAREPCLAPPAAGDP